MTINNNEDLFYKNIVSLLTLVTANGNPAKDTLNSYMSAINHFLGWCNSYHLNPLSIKEQQLIIYRAFLYEKNLNKKTILLKIMAIRKFYDAAIYANLAEKNPASNIKVNASIDEDDFATRYLTAGHLEFLIRLIPSDDSEENLRAKLMIVLMGIEGLRRVEVQRSNVEDLDKDTGIMIIHGKGKRSHIFPREDTIELLNKYIDIRYAIQDDISKTPLITSMSNNNRGHRISRDAINRIIDYWFDKAEVTNGRQDKLSCHLLRHTCGSLLYQETKDLRVVQETLRHADPKTTSKYAHIQDRMKNRYTNAIPVKIF